LYITVFVNFPIVGFVASKATLLIPAAVVVVVVVVVCNYGSADFSGL